MLLAIDVGNTQTVIGLIDAQVGDQAGRPGARISGEAGSVEEADTLRGASGAPLPGLRHSWRVATVVERTADEHALLLRDLLGLAGITLEVRDDRFVPGDIDGIAVSSSVPQVTSEVTSMAQRWFPVPLVVVGPRTPTGIAVAYDRPQDVGPDRLVDALAALDLYGAPVIVVDLGTATTFDAVSSAGAYLGGAIVPGVAISMEALASRAAALRKVELVAPPSVIGRSTVESIQSGAVLGTAALVDGMCASIAKELGGSPPVIATGGLAPVVVPHCARVSAHEPWLTLHGLRLVFDRVAGEG